MEGNLWKLMNLFFKHLERDLHFLLHGVCWFANEPALLNRIASYFQHANIKQVATVGNEQQYFGQIIMICRKQSRIDYTKALKKKLNHKKNYLSFCLSNFWFKVYAWRLKYVLLIYLKFLNKKTLISCEKKKK